MRHILVDYVRQRVYQKRGGNAKRVELDEAMMVSNERAAELVELDRIEEVYHAALEVAPERRSGFLAQACADDSQLRAEVDSLLSFAGAASSLIDTPPLDVAAAMFAAKKPTRLAGSKVGHYEIVSQIGVGGMGEVFLAKDTRLERKVAIKFISPKFAHDSDRLRRFVNEAKAASALNHPNIITVYEIAETDGTQFIATEFIDGITLRERMRREPLEMKSSLDIAVQVASAMQAAHGAGIIHRDIKPDNVMIRPDGLIKILDFGIAKPSNEPLGEAGPPKRTNEERALGSESAAPATFASSATSPGMILGTANYMSPEQVQGKTVDARSDIFSLGIVLYEMVRGQRAFGGANLADVRNAILHNKLASLTELSPDVPPEIERIINKALRKNPDERYQTAGDLLHDLKELQVELVAKAKAGRSPNGDRREKLGGLVRDRETDLNGSLTTASSAEIVLGAIKRRKAVVAISLLALIGIAAAGYSYLSPRSEIQITSVAVLPVANTSGDQNTEYLSDGITESLINELSKLSGVKVIARDSVFKYKGKQVDPERVARDLGVQAIVTGRVTQQGDNLQIGTEMMDVRDKSQMWGAHFNRRSADMLQVQEEILQQIVKKLRATNAEQQQLAKSTQAIPQAYELLLKGRYYQSRSSGDDAKKAVDCYNRALAIDANYADAYAALARAYLYLGENSFADPKETMPKAAAAAQRALDLDDSLAEAHLSMAGLKRVTWNWTEAEQQYKRAIELNPNLAAVHFRYAFFLSTQQRHDQAIAEIRRARELDPLKRGINNDIGYVLYFARKYDEAIEQYQIGLELDPNFGPAHYGRGFVYAAQAQYLAAINEYREMIRLSGEHTGVECYLGFALAKNGQRQEAEAILKRLRNGKGYVSQFELAILYAGLGEQDLAFSALERAYAAHDSQMQYLNIEPHFNELRTDARFASLSQRVDLPAIAR